VDAIYHLHVLDANKVNGELLAHKDHRDLVGCRAIPENKEQPEK
jgi:hypothetical protein